MIKFNNSSHIKGYLELLTNMLLMMDNSCIIRSSRWRSSRPL